jgi:putative transposase
VTDITYLIWQQKRPYVSTILDLQSRDIVAFVISPRNDIKSMFLIPCIKPSSRKKTRMDLFSIRIKVFSTPPMSISRCVPPMVYSSHIQERRAPLDNSIIENFHSLLKKEVLYNHEYSSFEKVVQAVSDWMTLYITSRLRLKK